MIGRRAFGVMAGAGLLGLGAARISAGSPAQAAADEGAIVDKFSHAVIVVQDIAAAIADFRALGFTVEPGARYGAGQSGINAYVRFGRAFIELLSVADRDAPPASRIVGRVFQQLVRDGASGLVAFGLGTRDIAEARRRFDRTGLSHYLNSQSMRHEDGLSYSWQVFILRDHPWRMLWPVVSRYDEAEELRMTALVPDHSNGARQIVGAVIRTDAIEEVEALYRTQLGLDLAADGRAAILPDGVRLTFESGGSAPLGIFELQVGVADLAAARGRLARAGVPVPAHGDLLIPPERLAGARLRLVQL